MLNLLTWLACTLVDAGYEIDAECVDHLWGVPLTDTTGSIFLYCQGWDGAELWDAVTLEFDAPWWVPLALPLEPVAASWY